MLLPFGASCLVTIRTAIKLHTGKGMGPKAGKARQASEAVLWILRTYNEGS